MPGVPRPISISPSPESCPLASKNTLVLHCLQAALTLLPRVFFLSLLPAQPNFPKGCWHKHRLHSLPSGSSGWPSVPYLARYQAAVAK